MRCISRPYCSPGYLRSATAADNPTDDLIARFLSNSRGAGGVRLHVRRPIEPGLSPIGTVSGAEARAEVASAKYTLAIVARQLAQVHTVTATYADTLDFDNPFVRLIRADETSYCVEYKKTEMYFLAGPGGTVALGSC
jgi:hypothetical protein